MTQQRAKKFIALFASLIILISSFFYLFSFKPSKAENGAGQVTNAVEAISNIAGTGASLTGDDAGLEQAQQALEQVQAAIEEIDGAISTVENIKKALESGDPVQAIQAVASVAETIKRVESSIKNIGQFGTDIPGLDAKTQQTLDKINSVAGALGSVTQAIQSGDPIAAISAVVDLADQLQTAKTATDVLKGDMGVGFGNLGLMGMELPPLFPSFDLNSLLGQAGMPITPVAGGGDPVVVTNTIPGITTLGQLQAVLSNLTGLMKNLMDYDVNTTQAKWKTTEDAARKAADAAKEVARKQLDKITEKAIRDSKDSVITNMSDRRTALHEFYRTQIVDPRIKELEEQLAGAETDSGYGSLASASLSLLKAAKDKDAFRKLVGELNTRESDNLLNTKPETWDDYLRIHAIGGSMPFFQLAFNAWDLISSEATAITATDDQLDAEKAMGGIGATIETETGPAGELKPKTTKSALENRAAAEKVVTRPFDELESTAAALSSQGTPEGISSGNIKDVLNLITNFAQQISSLGLGTFGQKLESGEASANQPIDLPTEAEIYNELTAQADLKESKDLLNSQGILRENSINFLNAQPLPLDLLSQKKNAQVRLLTDLKGFYLAYASTSVSCLPAWATATKENSSNKLSVDGVGHIIFDRQGTVSSDYYRANDQIEQTRQQLAKIPSLIADLDLAVLTTRTFFKAVNDYLKSSSLPSLAETTKKNSLLIIKQCLVPPCITDMGSASEEIPTKITPDRILSLRSSTVEFGRKTLANRNFVSQSRNVAELTNDTNKFNFKVVEDFSFLNLEIPQRNKNIQDEIGNLNQKVSELSSPSMTCSGFGGMLR